MRKQVGYLEIKSNDKYYFKGVSLIDIQNFFNEIKFKKKNIRIYQDIYQESEEKQTTLKDNRYYHCIKKRIKKFDTGNDCFIALKYYDEKVFEKSCNQIFYNNDADVINNSILFIAYIHDIDWLSIIVFNDSYLKNSFFEYIKRNAKMIKKKKIEDFYD